ncbi:hypothetical protein AUP68_15934 [Ilyonectria robusta]
MGAVKALQLLEGGRNVLSTSLDELRTGIISPEERLQKDAAREFGNFTAEISETPDVESFLLPPSEAEMYAAAHRGPIVVISTSLRCPASWPDRVMLHHHYYPGALGENAKTMVRTARMLEK